MEKSTIQLPDTWLKHLKEEFNQDYFNEIDKIENNISQGNTFNSLVENLDIDIIEVNEFSPDSDEKQNENLIFSKRSTKIDLIESGDNFLLYNIEKEYDRAPDLSDKKIETEVRELVYQKGKFDFNRKIIEEIQNKKFDNVKFSTAFSSFGSSLDRPNSICFNISSSFLFKPICKS